MSSSPSRADVTMGRCDDSESHAAPPGAAKAAAGGGSHPAPRPPRSGPGPLPAQPQPGTSTSRPWRPISDTSPVCADRRPWASHPRAAPRRPGPRRRARRRLPPCCRSAAKCAARTSPTWPRRRLLDAPAWDGLRLGLGLRRGHGERRQEAAARGGGPRSPGA